MCRKTNFLLLEVYGGLVRRGCHIGTGRWNYKGSQKNRAAAIWRILALLEDSSMQNQVSN
jgi:hypothetical protein